MRDSRDPALQLTELTVPHWGMRLLDHLMLLRPTVLMPVWTMSFLGAYQATPDRHPLLWVLLPGTLGWTLLAYSCIMGAVYVLNQLTDAETDALNNKLYLLAQGHVTRSAALAEMIGLGVLGYALAWRRVPVSTEFFVLLGISGLLGIAYSAPPIRLKGRPILDLLANAVGYGGIAYLVGWTSQAPAGGKALTMALPYVSCVGAAFVHSTLLDAEGDRQGGDRTTGILLGTWPACVFSFVLILVALLTSLWAGNWISLLAALFSLPLFGYTLFRRSLSDIALVMRISVALLTLIAALLIPYYLAALCSVLFGVRWYYRTRFSVRYPF